MSDKQGAPILPPLNRGAANNGGNNGNSAQQTVSLQQVLATAQGLNVLATTSGQQFVITTQVPGLTQVIPNNATTNASGTQQVTRIVNIAGTPPRNAVGGVGIAGTSPHSSPVVSRPQNSTKLMLTTSPKLVRTSISNMFVAPMSSSSSSLSSSSLSSSQVSSPQVHVQSPSPPARKRLKLSETTEKPIPCDAIGYRRRIMEHKMRRMRSVREKYVENASELFFLHTGGNMMDYYTWRKRSPTPQFVHFLRQHRLDPDDNDEDLTAPLSSIPEIPQLSAVATTTTVTSAIVTTTTAVTTVTSGSTVVQIPNQRAEIKIAGAGITPVAVSTTLPAAALAQLSHQGGTSVIADSSKSTTATSSVEKSSITTVASPKTPTTVALNSPQPVVKLVKLSTPTTITTSCDITNNQEQIVEKAKQEAYVMQRIAELQREGLWSERRLPKVQEPTRTKAHWDYLLEEMVWLAADFAQERKWKKAAAKKCARMVQKYFQEKAIQAQKAEKSQELRLKKIASLVAKEIKTFWTNVEKLVEYKQQTRLEEKRKKALDQHLNFIVGQTEKYSTWLTEGLNKTEGPQSIPASINSSRISSPVPLGKCHSDEEFQPNQSSDDDEETIAKAEEEMKLTTNHKEEVELLKRESEIPLEDLLKDLPPDYLDDRNRSLSPQNATNEAEQNENEEAIDADADFIAVSGESSDEEDTIMEEEKLEGDIDHKRELDELKADNEMSIDELAAKYANMSDVLMDVDEEAEGTDKESSDKEAVQEIEDNQITSSESESEDSDHDSDEEKTRIQSDTETDVGLQSLLEDPSTEKQSDSRVAEDDSDTHNEMDNVAALAESIQPKGNTLLTTSVVTKIPFLLKHSLREYQHIGLDWLVTMYDRKLNGILADEMGLGKTIQTIALLAHLACEKGNWGPHLIIVPTSVMLNWEMECKKWCPGFKILTYYGTQKERKQKRTGWTKPNAFHICITSYKLVIQDHQSFRRKKWKYLILDEAQNIKNFKSQRWQLLLNFQTQRRLLLTGTPLQNNLMELWSLMHFLMPNVFQSHREFKEWFSNPVTGMIEGNSEYNENIIRRLHKVLRPFLLRRLKTEVEKQLPKKYEHVVMCRLSKRQRFLYDDFMSRAKTKETLASGNLLSVINVLMQLRKVCNHPNLFEVRPTVSPFQMEAIEFVTASLVWSALDYNPFKHIQLSSLNLLLLDLETTLSAFVAHRMNRLRTPRKLIEEIDSQPEPAPRCPSGRIKINVRLSNQAKPQQQTQTRLKNLAGVLPTPRVGVTLRVAGGQQLQGYSLQLVPHQGSVKAIPVATLGHNPQNTTVTSTTATTNAQRITVGNASIRDSFQRLTTQTVTVKQGDSVQRIAMPSFAQLVQTSTGRHFILTSSQQNTNTVSFPVMTSSGPRFTVLSKSLMGLSTSGTTTMNKVVSGIVTTPSGRPVMRVPPLNVTASQSSSSGNNGQQIASQQQPQSIRGIVTRQTQKEVTKAQNKDQPKSEFYLPQLEEEKRQRRQAKLNFLANINERRCAACPLYGEDLFMALRIGKPATACRWHNGWVHCTTTKERIRTRKEYFSHTEALAEAIKSTEQIVEELKEVFERYVVYVPAVRAPVPRFHVSHPPPHKLWNEQRLWTELQRQLSPKLSLFHPISSLMLTQFPDPRLIQYDCGKLQSLDRLLRKLKSENHRVLIFTQMTRMLDVLEAFLNFHGHIYLRLDGTTRVDQRQVLMERFNGDKRIFCFILSTRSGGVGVNLTGADTVIFYDSDWNPTMDAQAQDRCHRIGQTRDVHIYRLVSEKTVEENILKKANQKRLLGDLAIEGGNFTTAYFKSSTIQDLFNIDQTENDASARMAEVLEQSRDREKSWSKDMAAGSFQSNSLSGQHTEEKAAMGALESALAAAEEDLDVQAAKTAKAEAVADLAEFDENIPLEEADKDDAQVSKAEQEVQNLIAQLTPIERYAMKFVEESEGAFSAAQLAAAERELEEQKKEWELDRLRALREEEERRMRLADDDEKPLTFGREDAQNQVNSTAAKGGPRRLVSKRLIVPSRRSLRRRGDSRKRRVRELSSESENETTSTESDSDSESQEEDVVEDSLDEESSHTESQSQEDEGEEEEGEGDEGGGGEKEESDEEEEAGEGNEDGRANKFHRDNSERGGGFSRRKGRLAGSGSCSRNHFDLNSPRTRSRGNVQINLWTLDVSPILPGVKPNFRRQGKKFHRAKFEETLSLSTSVDVCGKKSIRINANVSAKVSAKVCANSDQNTKTEITETEADRGSSKNKRDSKKDNCDFASFSIDSNGVEQCVTNSNAERSVDDHVDSTTQNVKTQSNQTRISESTCDDIVDGQNVKKEKERSDEKIMNGTNLITGCSVQVTRCSHKILSATYKKLESEVNRNEDAENLDVNVSARDSRSPPSTEPDVSLKETMTKSKSEFGASTNSLCNNVRGKLAVVASKESDRSVESPSSRSVPFLRSKMLRNGSPDAETISKPVTISRVFTMQRSSKTNVNTDEACGNEIKDKDKNNCDETNDDAESAMSTMQKSGQKLNSKSESSNALLQVAEKGTNDTVSNSSDFLAPLAKNEFNSNESKCKIRKVESIAQRSVTTRSSKVPLIVNHLEESNARLMNDKINLVSENKNTRRADNSQHPIAELSRITRSASHSWTPPLPPPLPSISGDETTTQNLSKLTPRRQPDTPLPRPITRSVATVNFSRIDTVLPNRIEKNTIRNSKQCQDNGLLSPPMPFRRSRSIPPMKPDSEGPAKRRPDTPRPNMSPSNNEQEPRVTRSGLLLNSALSSKSASLPLSSPAAALRTSTKHQVRAPSTSSESENTASSTSLFHEKPQRTAKVVAILTLDTRNSSSKTSSSQSKSNINCETKVQDKELSASRLSDSLKEQEVEHEGCDSSDVKSRRLRRETKRVRTVPNSVEDEDGSNDINDEDPTQKRSRSSQISPSSSSSVATTRSEKLKGTTIS